MIGCATMNDSTLAAPHRLFQCDAECTPLPCRICLADAVYMASDGGPLCTRHWLQRFIAPWIK